MFKKILLSIFLIPIYCFSEINIGPAINNLHNRLIVVENKTTIENLVATGFLTNEIDKLAFDAIGNMTLLNTDETNLVLSINMINDKSSYPVRVYAGNINTEGTNTWIEFSGSDILLYTNNIFSTTLATTNDLYNLFISILNGSTLKNIETINTYLSVYSNKVYKFSTGTDGIIFSSPEFIPNKENILNLHLFKDIGNVTWFNNINWIYGEEPQFEVTNTNYVFKFYSLDGTNWRGWLEYIY